MIGTYRDVEVARRHPLALTLAELTREQLFQRILLRGLTQEDVGRFIELVAGVVPAAALVGAVYRQTEGNPLFVTEVVRLLVQEGHLSSTPGEGEGSAAWLGRIPEGIREVIGRRLDRLSERCNQVLTVASVIGREFTLAQVQPLVEDLPRLRLLEVLEEALAARVIEELPRAAGRYQFTHALIQETLVEELSTTRRVQMHAQIAEALEGLYGAEAEAHAAELAHHFAEAAGVTGTDKLVHYSLVAGERALASHAFEEALAFFQQGLSAKGAAVASDEAAADAETAALLFGLGRAQMATLPVHQVPEAVATLRRAFAYYARAGDVARAVAVAESPPPIAPGTVTGAAELVAEALALVPPDSAEAGGLLGLQGRLLGLEGGDLDGAREALGRALDIARRLEDPVLEMRALADAAEVEVFYLDEPRAMERAQRAVELAPRADDPRAEMLVHYWIFYLRMLAGEPQQAAPNGAATLAAAERLRHHFYLARALFVNALLAELQGQWKTAREFVDRGLQISAREVRLLMLRTVLEYQVGEFSEAEACLERLLEVMRLTPPGPSVAHAGTVLVLGIVSRISGSSDRGAIAKEIADVVLSSPSATPLLALMSRYGLALTAVQEADAPAARELYRAFKGFESSSEGGWALLVGFTDQHHLLGLLAETLGEREPAIAHFEDSMAFCRRAGYLPALAWACVDCAHTLLHRDSHAGRPAPNERARAAALLDEGLRIARELGMRPLVERALRDKDLLTA